MHAISTTRSSEVEIAAHLVDHVFPRLPVRQWLLSLPKRLRYFLRHDRRTVTAVLAIFLRVVEQVLRERAAGAAPRARLGAVCFVHRLLAPSLGLTPSGPCFARRKFAPGEFVG